MQAPRLREPRWPIAGRALLALVLVVLLAHVLVLRNVAVNLGAGDVISTRVFTTRSISLAPPPAPRLPRRPAMVTPRPAPEPPPRPLRPKT
ncbi:MAG: DUF3108 domain-containing protein, partial [Betaproteobacteria bacterium]